MVKKEQLYLVLNKKVLLLLLATQDFLNIFIPYHSSSSACPNTSEIWTDLAL